MPQPGGQKQALVQIQAVLEGNAGVANRVGGEIAILRLILLILHQHGEGVLRAGRVQEVIALIVDLVGITVAGEGIESIAVDLAVDVVAGDAEQMFPRAAEQAQLALQAQQILPVVNPVAAIDHRPLVAA